MQQSTVITIDAVQDFQCVMGACRDNCCRDDNNTEFPKLWDSVNGKLEYWLSLSCPAVVRQVLYSKERIGFVGVTVNVPAPEPKPGDMGMNKVRTMLFEIIDFDKFSIKDKLLYMGLFMRSLSKSNDIDNVISTYRGNMHNKGLLDSIKTDLGKMEAEIRQTFFNNLADLAEKVVSTTQISKQHLPDAFDRLIVSYVNENAYVFSNYLMYTAFSSGFLKDTEDYAQAYAGFAGEFLIMLTFAAGLFNQQESIGHEEMITAIYLYHRKISHSNEVRRVVAETFTDNILSLLLGTLGDIN
ncbi:MAG: hypothetical protein FWB91_02745 [Defluviitaleaceae bacterium]|nr:hypothetical protein [Defluviitaleaceae bacterium]